MMGFIALTALLVISGCAQIGNLPAPSASCQADTLREFTRADVQTALDIAAANGDKQGQNCFAAVLAVLPESNPAPTQPTGLVSLYEAGRVARMGLQAGLPDSVVSACAPMVLNSQAALLNAISFVRLAP